MTHSTKNLRESYLDGEVLFRKYYEMGDAATFQRLIKFAKYKNMVSSTGDVPTAMGLWKAMWRWASLKENKESAWAIYHQWRPDTTPEEWRSMMLDRIKKAWQYRTNARYERFLKENEWV